MNRHICFLTIMLLAIVFTTNGYGGVEVLISDFEAASGYISSGTTHGTKLTGQDGWLSVGPAGNSTSNRVSPASIFDTPVGFWVGHNGTILDIDVIAQAYPNNTGQSGFLNNVTAVRPFDGRVFIPVRPYPNRSGG